MRWLQPIVLGGRVVELGSLKSHALKQDGYMVDCGDRALQYDEKGDLMGCAIALANYLFTARKNSMIALLFPGQVVCDPVPSQ